uniref:Putative secreted protein n=1 Tax=Anopheles triannulatus TaxID=58253 RepID=A0A2M4B2B0_9DIPT
MLQLGVSLWTGTGWTIAAAPAIAAIAQDGRRCTSVWGVTSAYLTRFRLLPARTSSLVAFHLLCQPIYHRSVIQFGFGANQRFPFSIQFSPPASTSSSSSSSSSTQQSTNGAHTHAHTSEFCTQIHLQRNCCSR